MNDSPLFPPFLVQMWQLLADPTDIRIRLEFEGQPMLVAATYATEEKWPISDDEDCE